MSPWAPYTQHAPNATHHLTPSDWLFLLFSVKQGQNRSSTFTGQHPRNHSLPLLISFSDIWSILFILICNNSWTHFRFQFLLPLPWSRLPSPLTGTHTLNPNRISWFRSLFLLGWGWHTCVASSPSSSSQNILTIKIPCSVPFTGCHQSRGYSVSSVAKRSRYTTLQRLPGVYIKTLRRNYSEPGALLGTREAAAGKEKKKISAQRFIPANPCAWPGSLLYLLLYSAWVSQSLMSISQALFLASRLNWVLL